MQESTNRITKSLELIYQYGCIDGAHHKQWLIDQIVRTLTKDKYNEWVEVFNSLDDNGNCYGEWDTGIAP